MDRTNFRDCSYRTWNFLVWLFQDLKTTKCFPFSRKKSIDILEQILETVATEAQTFWFGFFSKYIYYKCFPFSRKKISGIK